jgi:hypothetical protein
MGAACVAQATGRPAPYDWVHASAIGAAGEFDAVHNHAGEPAMALRRSDAYSDADDDALPNDG